MIPWEGWKLVCLAHMVWVMVVSLALGYNICWIRHYRKINAK